MDLSTVKKFLKSQSREELLKVIARLSNYSGEAEEWLLEYCERHGEVDDKKLITRKQIQHEWDVAEQIIDEANEYGGTDYRKEDEAYDCLSRMGELVKFAKIDWDFRKSIIDGMFRQFDYGNSGFEDSLVDTCEDFCQTDEEMLYLAELLKGCSSDYYREYSASLFLKHGKEDEFVEIQSKNLHYGSDYIKLANYYKKKKKTDKALELMETALAKADGRMDEVYIWLFDFYSKKKAEDKIQALYAKAVKKKRDLSTILELMYRHYPGDYEKQKFYLLKIPQECRSDDVLKWYTECQKILSKKDFAAHSQELHEIVKKKNLRGYLQLRIDEGYKDEVIEYLKEHPGRNDFFDVDYGHVLSRQLSATYPMEVCLAYWNQCNNLCSSSNKKNYMSAVKVLKEIRSIYKKNNMEDVWKSRFAEFVEKNQRKSLLIGYMRSEGLI